MAIWNNEHGSTLQRRIGIFMDAIVPELNFITIHYAYFIVVILLVATVFWGAATPFRSVSFTDALFLTTSAMTETGLNTINLSTINTFQQVLLFCLMLIGSAIFVSIGVIFVRLRAFEREFQRNIKERRDEKQRMQADMREAGFRRTKSVFHRAPTRTQSQEKDTNVLARAGSATENPDTSKVGAIGETTSKESPKATAHDHAKLIENNGDTESGSSSHSHERPQLALQIDGVRDRGPDRTVAFELSPMTRTSTAREPANNVTSPVALTTQRSNSSWSHSSRNAGNHHERMRPPIFSFTGVGATSRASLRPRSHSLQRSGSKRNLDAIPEFPKLQRAMTLTGRSTNPWFLSATGYFTRNSQVHGLSLEERQELGGREYSAILFLAFIVPFYWFIWQFLGAIAVGAWVQNHRAYLAEANGINPFWVGAFTAISAFGNAGMMLLDANMVAFQDAIFMLLTLGLFILAGNTMYPVFLRIAIWTMWKILPDDEFWKFDKETLRFLLDHPRRCYTHLFPKRHTWWLGLCVLVLNGIDWAFYPILNIGNNDITQIDDGLEVIDGLFQSLAVRSGGFYVVPLSSIRISLQVLYLVMMYISVYPVAITMRNSNVYEERSLGIFAEDQQEQDLSEVPPSSLNNSYEAATKAGLIRRHETPSKEKSSRRMAMEAPFGGLKRTFTIAAQAPRRENHSTFIRQQVRAQLSHDAWWICLAVFLITIIEGARFESNPTVFSAFNIMFEVVSGYACVGMSIGVPWDAYSFSGAWHGLSKLVMIAVMIRGRHRGLPVAIDHALQLPGRKQWEAEEEDGRVRMERSFTLRDGSV